MNIRFKALTVFIVLLIPAGFAFSHSSSGWNVPDEAKAIKNPVPATAESSERGKQIYTVRCVVCHGEKGDGKGTLSANLAVKPANFTDKEMMASMTDGEIFWKITNGRGAMPSWKETLKDNERWDIVNLIRSFSAVKSEK